MSLQTSDTVPMSPDGFRQRSAELELLRTDARRELAERLRDARHDGDLDDNPELVGLLQEQALLEQRIALLEAQLAAAEIVEPAGDGTVGIGSLVRVRDVQSGDVFEYELVGPLESDALNGRVSTGAPVGKALVGARRGDRVEVSVPRGAVALEVVAVRTARRTASSRAA
jgi:transcription elongation factor GreA